MDAALIINILLGVVNAIFFFILKFMFDRDKQNEDKINSLEKDLNEAKTILSDKIVSSMRAHEKKIDDLHLIDIEKQLTANTNDIEWLKKEQL